MTDHRRTVAFACSRSDAGDGGVYRYRMDPNTGELTELGRKPSPDSSFAVLHPEHTHLYVANRTSEGAVTAYEIDSGSGELKRVDRTRSGATDPCYLGIDTTGSYVFVANYSDGTVGVIPITDRGGLADSATVIQREGSSVHPKRQQVPHPHSIEPGPRNRHVFVPDLGTDTVGIYELRSEDGSVRLLDSNSVATSDGAGPRHFAFHPTGEALYVINELDSTLTGYSYDPATGALSETTTVSTLPASHDGGENFASEIRVHPSGDWLYCSNRGHDSIAVFEIGDYGGLERLEHESTRGHWPRHFALDPAGRFLYVENRRSNTIVTFEISETGIPRPTGDVVSIPEPLCVVFGSLSRGDAERT